MANPHLLTGLGSAFAIFLSAVGTCAASVPGGIFAQHAAGGVFSFAPIIIGGVLAIYGCIIAVILSHSIANDEMTEAQGYKNLSAGLAVGLTCLSSGLGMAHFVQSYMYQSFGDRSGTGSSNGPTNSNSENQLQDPLISNRWLTKPLLPTWRFLMVLVFIEAIGLYGLVVALFLSG